MVKKLHIEGIAVVEGISRNNINYTAEELDKFAPTLKGRPILKDHNGITDNVIGLVTESQSVDGGKKVRYKGWIKDESVIEKIMDERIKEVSIGAMVGQLVKESEDDDEAPIAKNMYAMELSTTPVPGVNGTSLVPSGMNESFNYTEEDIKKIITDYTYENKIHNQIIEKEVNMTENENQKDVVVESQTVQATQTNDVEEKLKAAEEKIKALEGALREEAITAYKKACEAKSIATVGFESLSIEAIKALTAQVLAIPAKENVEAKVEDVKVEVKKEEAKEEVKTDAEVKTLDVEATEKVKSSSDGYVIESASLGGSAFGKF